MTSGGYLRFPHLHGDVLAFVADDDVWLALAALLDRPAARPPDTAERPSRQRPPLPPRR